MVRQLLHGREDNKRLLPPKYRRKVTFARVLKVQQSKATYLCVKLSAVLESEYEHCPAQMSLQF